MLSEKPVVLRRLEVAKGDVSGTLVEVSREARLIKEIGRASCRKRVFNWV